MDKQAGADDANASRDEQQNDDCCNFRLINFLIEHEKAFRIDCNRLLLESPAGMILNQIVAIVFGSTTFIYISVTYFDDAPLILERWFVGIEKIICMGMLFFYGFTIYVKQ